MVQSWKTTYLVPLHNGQHITQSISIHSLPVVQILETETRFYFQLLYYLEQCFLRSFFHQKTAAVQHISERETRMAVA